VRYLSLAEALVIAEAVTGIDTDVLTKTSAIDLLDSALHAPQASFGGHEFYPRFIDKAAVLAVRIARNHPLPDGNKRLASPVNTERDHRRQPRGPSTVWRGLGPPASRRESLPSLPPPTATAVNPRSNFNRGSTSCPEPSGVGGPPPPGPLEPLPLARLWQ
jgi:hypothetical protein